LSDHFCSSSYEFLNGTDERGQLSTASNLPTTEQIQTADECARRTLDICMSKMLLNNLQRAATAGYSALVRRSCQLFRSKEKFVRRTGRTWATPEICFPPGNNENRNPELGARQPQVFASLSPAKKFG